MIYNKHFRLEGKHAFLSASKYSWLNYDEDKMERAFIKHLSSIRGTELHILAAQLIKLGVGLPLTNATLNSYVNDAIGFKMQTEIPLYYSENSFGTTDAISYRNNMLRIHDLKTGHSPTSFKQLEIYASLFCLEYDVDPNLIDIELRIYQSDKVHILNPTSESIMFIMEKIKSFDKVINKLKMMEE